MIHIIFIFPEEFLFVFYIEYVYKFSFFEDIFFGYKVLRWHVKYVCSVTQSYPTPCDPMDHSPPGSSVHGASQAGMLQWVGISSSHGSSQPCFTTSATCMLDSRLFYLPFMMGFNVCGKSLFYFYGFFL